MMKTLFVMVLLTAAAIAQTTPTYNLEVPPVGTTPYSSIIYNDFLTLESLLNGSQQIIALNALTGTFGTGGGLITMTAQSAPAPGVIAALGTHGCFTDSTLLIWRCQDASGNDISGTYFLKVNGGLLTPTDTINLNAALPAVPSNGINVQFATSNTSGIDSISAAVIGDGNATHFLNGQGSFTAPAGGGFSTLSPGTNTNLGTFAMSGNSWDATGATLFKLRAASGAVVTTNGDIAENTVTGNWHFWDGIDALIVGASAGGTFTIGDCLQVASFTPFRVTDTGNPCGGSSSGTLLQSIGPQAAITGTASPVTVYSYTIPGGTMTTTSCIKATVGFQHSTGIASTTYTWTYGGSSWTSSANALVGSGQSTFRVCNSNSTNSQFVAAFQTSIIGNTPSTSMQSASTTANTALAQTVSFQFNVAATDKVTPLNWVVEHAR